MLNRDLSFDFNFKQALKKEINIRVAMCMILEKDLETHNRKKASYHTPQKEGKKADSPSRLSKSKPLESLILRTHENDFMHRKRKAVTKLRYFESSFLTNKEFASAVYPMHINRWSKQIGISNEVLLKHS